MVAILISSVFVSLAALVVADASKRTNSLPDFVLKYAPLSYLHSAEQYWPTDVQVHLPGVIPEVNFVPVGGTPTLETLSTLASNVSLTGTGDVLNHNTEYFTSIVGKPSNVTGYSAAPGTIIVVDKPGGITDAFFFYFYSWNEGNSVLGITFGDHVGDWEHTMVRFINGVPSTVYFSEHSGGSAYEYSVVEKSGVRPVTYIGIGTHANYATPGDHDYSLPFGLLKDQTDKGYLWDMTQNFRGFLYNPSTGEIDAASGAGPGGTFQLKEGTSWLNFGGEWGDKQWPTSKFGQYCIDNECHFSDGPTGPLSKNLGRTLVCQDESSCIIETTL